MNTGTWPALGKFFWGPFLKKICFNYHSAKIWRKSEIIQFRAHILGARGQKVTVKKIAQGWEGASVQDLDLLTLYDQKIEKIEL